MRQSCGECGGGSVANGEAHSDEFSASECADQRAQEPQESETVQ